MSDYISAHGGADIDAAVTRAASGGAIDAEIAALNQSLAAVNTYHASLIAANTTRAETNAENIDELSQSLAAVNTRFDGEVSALQSDVSGLNSRVTALEQGSSGGGGNANAASGSYTGTGQYGSSHPCSITLNFSPKAVFITSDSGTFYMVTPIIAGASRCQVFYYGPSDSTGLYNLHCEISGMTVSWYCENSTGGAYAQMNAQGMTYHYAAIG